MEISKIKTKVMFVSKQHEDIVINLDGIKLEQVTQFSYLGSILTEDNNTMTEVRSRIAKGLSVLSRLQRIWNDIAISLKTKIKLLESIVFPVFLYASETWTLLENTKRRIEAFEMKCFRRVLKIR